MSPVDGCTHPRARHEHATDAAYKAGCCRCRDCTDASTRAVKRARYARTHGRPGIVAAEPVRAHMRRLVAAGMTVSRIALAAGMRATDGRRIATSTSDVIRRTTAEAILAVTPAPLTVSSVGARRRIQALALLGWSMPAICDAGGIAPGTLRGAQVEDRITLRTNDAIRHAHDLLWDTTPPDTWQTRRRSAQAGRAGYAPTLAWDDIDDPAEQPSEWQRHDPSFRHAAEHAAAVDDLMAVGYSRDTAIAEVAYRHRVQVASVLVALDRHERRAA